MVKFNNFNIYYRSRGTNYNSNFKSTTHDYYITVLNTETSAKVGFMYHEGIGHKAGKPDLLNALYCLYSDAISYINSTDFCDFCADFGYNVYDTSAKRIYNACKKQYEKCQKLSDDIWTVYDTLNEAINS